jgi:hypothetical protein
MIKLLSQIQQTVNYYQFEVGERIVNIIEYVDDRGKVIDTIFEDPNGNPIEPELQEQICEIIDEMN